MYDLLEIVVITSRRVYRTGLPDAPWATIEQVPGWQAARAEAGASANS